MLKRSKLITMLVVMALVLSVANMAFAMDVPREEIQVIADDSMDIQSTYNAGMGYKEWKELYGKIVRDEARFSEKYPDSRYSMELKTMMMGYDMANQGWYRYMNTTDSERERKMKEVIQTGMNMAKTSQDELNRRIK